MNNKPINNKPISKRSILRVAGVFLILHSLTAPVAIADAPANLRIEVHYNFLTGDPNIWNSTGAFVDSGYIGVAETVETFSPGTFKRAKVTGPIVSEDGSTIKWMFTKVWTFTSESTLVSHGQWHIIEGTGRYAGIKGQGDVEGDLDAETGAVNDVFTGWVTLP